MSSPTRGGRALLLYDADCGFCARTARLVRRWSGPALNVRALQSVDLGALGVDRDRAATEIPFVRRDGTVSYGHAAFADALAEAGPWGHLPARAMRSRWGSPLARAGYAWVAAHRHRLPGGTPGCDLSVGDTGPGQQPGSDRAT